MTNVVPYCVRQNRALVEQVLQLGQGVGTQSPKEKAGRRPGPKVPDSPVTTARPRQGPRLQLAKCWGLRARRGRSRVSRESPAPFPPRGPSSRDGNAPRAAGEAPGDGSDGRRPEQLIALFTPTVSSSQRDL